MANEYLQRTPTSTGNRKTWTWSGWFKRNTLQDDYLFSAGATSTNIFYVCVRRDANNNNITILFRDGDTTSHTLVFDSNSYRDVGSWMHVVVSVDTTKTTNSDRCKVYINGSQLTNPTTNTLGDLNTNSNSAANSLELHTIGEYSVSSGNTGRIQLSDYFFVDGQALTPDVFGYYKKGDGYISAGSTQATDFKRGQWVPKAPKVIKSVINARGGFGVNGFYLPMNDASNFGADFHCEPNSIIKLKGEDFNEYPQPRNGAPETTDGYVSQLRDDSYKDYLVLAIPGIKGGRQSGYGDYSADIKGSGTNKVMTAVGGAGVTDEPSFYGSAISIAGSGNPVSYIETPASPDFDFNSDDFTVEFWEYRDTANNTPIILDSNVTVYAPLIAYTQSGNIVFYATDDDSAGSAWDIANAVSFGPSLAGQWNHIALCRKGTQFYLLYNGVVTNTFTSSKSIYQFANKITIGRAQNQATFDGKIQDLRVYKGVAKYTSGFDIVKPYTPVGIGTWRAVPDCTANNFATLNPLQVNRLTFSDGNLSWSATTAYTYGQGTISVPKTGKWVFEGRFNSNTSNNNYNSIGVGTTNPVAAPFTINGNNGYGINDAGPTFGQSFVQGGVRQGSITLGSGDIIQVLIDRDNNQMNFVKNGTLQTGTGSTVTIPSDVDLYTMIGEWNVSGQINFGQNPTFSGNTTAGTFTDSNGKGLFKYEPPTDFLALCEDNLPTPAIKNPGEYFKTVLYAGDSNAGRSIVGVGFTPDLVWVKHRNNAGGYGLYDSVRGPGRRLDSQSTNGESIAEGVLSFDSDGFSLGSTFNTTDRITVGWCWSAGAGTTTANTAGSIPSVVSVNQDAGFSIVSYVYGSGAQSIGHGLEKTPKFIMMKNRSGVNNWDVYHSSVGPEYRLILNSTVAKEDYTGPWNDTSPTSSVFYTNGWLSTGVDVIAYCWAEIEGFSKFGSYVGNGSTDGPFVYCGFKPAWVMVRAVNSLADWVIMDSSRSSTNPNRKLLYANLSNIEGDGIDDRDPDLIVDFLSNGFKCRATNNDLNNTETYIFAAFAESPFQTANAK
jgi:hypothetical protein